MSNQQENIICDSCGRVLRIPLHVPADFYTRLGRERHGWALDRRADDGKRLDFCPTCPDKTITFKVVSTR